MVPLGGSDPADTPANGGSRRAAPPGICFDDGQRPTIHRLRQRRGPRKGPWASVTPPNRETRTLGCDGTGFFPTPTARPAPGILQPGYCQPLPEGAATWHSQAEETGLQRRRGGHLAMAPHGSSTAGGGWQSPFLRCRPRCGTESPPGTERLPIWQGRSVGGRPSGPASRWLSIPRGTPALTVRPVHDHHPSHISTGHRRGQK
ncbi:hypothetical protein MAP00_009248 [Monascus purpureus]|nr:hypothetical protein MAP00_009248 [Monascus purpureus]